MQGRRCMVTGQKNFWTGRCEEKTAHVQICWQNVMMTGNKWGNFSGTHCDKYIKYSAMRHGMVPYG